MRSRGGTSNQLLAAICVLAIFSGKNAGAAGPTWTTAGLATAVAVMLAGWLVIWAWIIRPLNALLAAVRRYSTSDRSSRAAVTGSAQVRELAQAFNAQIEENQRLLKEAVGILAEQARNDRLRRMARAVGDPLTADGVIREARSSLEETVDADIVYVHPIVDGRVLPPRGHEDDWLFADAFTSAVPDEMLLALQELLRAQTGLVINDIRGQEGERVLPDEALEFIRRAGVVSLLITPFGVGGSLLGFIAIHRLQPGRGWQAAEIDAVESIAADLGRGLHHARLYEAQRRLVHDLRALDEARSGFFATVSHELKAPLTSIEGYVEMLGDPDVGPLNDKQRKMMETVERNISRLRNLIEDVFTLAKLESGGFGSEAKPVNLAEIIIAAVDAIRPLAAAHNLMLVAEPGDSGLHISGDARQLDRVVINLLTNAVKFTPEGGRIRVAAATEDESVVLRVSDTGIGIPQDEQEELFGRFFRASNARRLEIQGTGLGLAIVRSIVAGHGGEITVSSEEGRGATFTVRLPRPVPGGHSALAGSAPKTQ